MSQEKKYSKVVLLLLALFVGGLGIHQFLAGNTKRAIMYIALGIGGYVLSMILAFVFLPLAMIGTVTNIVLFVFIILDIVKIAKGQFMHVDGYSLVE